MEKENKKTIEIPFGAKDSELNKFEYTIPEGYEVRIEGNKVIIEKLESYDERIRKTLIHIVKGACNKYGIKYMGDKITEEKLLAYLEKQKEQKPAEWSEEDKTALGDLLWCIEQARKSAKDENDMGNIWFAENWVKNRLKYLRPQPKQEWSEKPLRIAYPAWSAYRRTVRRSFGRDPVHGVRLVHETALLRTILPIHRGGEHGRRTGYPLAVCRQVKSRLMR